MIKIDIWKKHGTNFLPCPCCGISSLKEYARWEICSVCGWEDEAGPNMPDDWEGHKNGPNHMTLSEYRKEWEDSGKQFWGWWLSGNNGN